ncbi:hypothetical protein DAEQUDRAFT_807539 [Daedalea quercina L-15889]|uniref:BTB domain-containing protein n=1 Tax=Daedalea quercina L-15889 TaxID=1314783 RepID=A0A165U4W2_9APHY|nr:hypothetical protein DAEQUDRAFT_807539 [Daedalea quercina L-15889]
MASGEASVSSITTFDERSQIGNLTGAESSPLVPDADFWYPDGTVVLLARTKVAFRVHKGILADHSTVFCDLFAVAQPQGEERYAECPTVNLTDAPGEVKYLLKVLYRPRRYYMPDQRVSFAMVAALLRLGHKYAIDDFVSSTLSRLATCFSSSFETYYASITTEGSPDMTCIPEDAITAVNLARLVGEDASMILPSALYTCCQLPSSTLTRGVISEDGDVQKLSDADLDLCIDARVRLSALALASAVQRCQFRSDQPNDQGTEREGSARCMQAFCAPYLAAAASRVLAGTLGLPNPTGALDSLDWFVADSTRGGLLCRVCAESIREKDKEERLRIWKMLPRILGLQVKEWSTADQRKI